MLINGDKVKARGLFRGHLPGQDKPGKEAFAMSWDPVRNQAFLRNIYAKGPFQGHAFLAAAPGIPLHAWPGGDYTLSDRPVQEWVPWVVENYRRMVAHAEAVGDDGVPVAKLMTGTHLYAAAFGCPAHQSADNPACALPRATCVAEAEALAEPDLWSSRPLMRVFELADLVRRELGPDVPLGPPDIQTGFDTAALVWEKQDFLCAMALEPEAVHSLSGKCARLLKAFLAELRREFPTMSPCHCPGAWCPPEMGWWASNDECGAMGTEMFEEFCLPELIDLSRTFGGFGMHCCADAEHQFDSFRAIPNFYAFNRVGARLGWLTILDHPCLLGPEGPVFVLAWVSDDDTEALIRRAPPGTRFIFQSCEPDPAKARDWIGRMRAIPANA